MKRLLFLIMVGVFLCTIIACSGRGDNIDDDRKSNEEYNRRTIRDHLITALKECKNENERQVIIKLLEKITGIENPVVNGDKVDKPDESEVESGPTGNQETNETTPDIEKEWENLTVPTEMTSNNNAGISKKILAPYIYFRRILSGEVEKYADAKAVMEKQFAAFDEFGAACEKAGNAEDVAAAIDKFTAAMKDLTPKMKELQEKYPDLMKQTEPPDELKESLQRGEEASKKLSTGMQKAMQYATDPKVQEAQKKLVETMKAIQ
ncbi:MAG: hypothetical protein KAW12_01715 [Candidatus Aminicenantes bacterium]|nr:hypothetical protein [Candidatus Aminicenantes bacterium]